MGRIRVAGLVVLASLGLGATGASAREVVTFQEFLHEEGHGFEPLPTPSFLGLEVSQFEISTARGATECAPSFLATLLTNQKPTDLLRIDAAYTPEACGAGPASAEVHFERLPWWLTVSANRTATLAGATMTLAYAGGPTCLYRAPSLAAQFDAPPLGWFLSFDAHFQLLPTRAGGCSPWATVTALFAGIAVSAPFADAVIEDVPAFTP